jgi:hypothetical protein
MRGRVVLWLEMRMNLCLTRVLQRPSEDENLECGERHEQYGGGVGISGDQNDTIF